MLFDGICFNCAMSAANSFVDGKPCNTLPMSDRGFAYGHGLFETMRLWRGGLPLLDRHLDRLRAGAGVLGIHCDIAAVQVELDDILRQLPADGVLRLTLTAGTAPRGYRYPSAVPARRVVQYYPWLKVSTTRQVVQICEYRLPDNAHLAGIKHLNRLDQVMAAREVVAQRDGLLLDPAGHVIEALSSNIFICHAGRWLTPGLKQSGVAGVMRGVLLSEILPGIGLDCLRCEFDLSVLEEASEVFLCNAVSGIVPVGEAIAVGKWAQGPDFTRIQAALSERYPCFAE